MDEEFAQALAAQLRKPSGKDGLEVAERMNKSNRRMNWLAIEKLGLLASKGTAMELGIGNGLFATELLEKNIDLDYIGVDYSPTMIMEAQQRNYDFCTAGRARFILSTADKIPLKGNSIDFCWGANIYYFWDQPLIELNELKRVLKPGGKLAISMRSDESLKTLPVTQFGFSIYEEHEVKQHLEEAGFKNIELVKEEEIFKLPEEDKEVHLTTWVWLVEK